VQPLPNILIFMTDQQRGSTVAADSPVKTPRLDRFAADAVRFSDARCPSPHCCPSRATFFTGLYPSRHGVWNNVCVENALGTGPHDGIRLWSESLAEAGYQLDWNGKWHVCRDRGPEDFGFKVHTITAGARRHGQGIMGATWADYPAAEYEPNPANPEQGTGCIRRPGLGDYVHYGEEENPFGDADQVASAIDVINSRQKTNTPWCHFIGPLGPHDPYFAPRRFLELYDLDAIELPASFNDAMADKPGLYRRTRARFDQLGELGHHESLRHYYALCSYEDWLFGQVLDALDASGQADNTLVIYCSDHGDYMADHGLWCKGLPCFRGAYEVPLLIRWPQFTQGRGRTEAACVSLADIAPTLLEAAGLYPQQPLSGSSLCPFIKGEQPADWRDAHFTQTNGNELYGIQRSVSTREWKLVYNGFDEDELYHLTEDPHECQNLAKREDLKPIRQALYRRLWQFACEQQDVPINNYIMTGLAEFGPGIAFHKTPTISLS
jgi:arylsulfatase A-like enzyme